MASTEEFDGDRWACGLLCRTQFCIVGSCRYQWCFLLLVRALQGNSAEASFYHQDVDKHAELIDRCHGRCDYVDGREPNMGGKHETLGYFQEEYENSERGETAHLFQHLEADMERRRDFRIYEGLDRSVDSGHQPYDPILRV